MNIVRFSLELAAVGGNVAILDHGLQVFLQLLVVRDHLVCLLFEMLGSEDCPLLRAKLPPHGLCLSEESCVLLSELP